MRLKKGDLVIVITGIDKGKKGVITKVIPKNNKILVSKINTVKKHIKPTQSESGKIITKEMPIHISNVAYFDENLSKNSRIGYKEDAGNKVRFVKKSNKILVKNIS